MRRLVVLSFLLLTAAKGNPKKVDIEKACGLSIGAQKDTVQAEDLANRVTVAAPVLEVPGEACDEPRTPRAGRAHIAERSRGHAADRVSASSCRR